jgi:hypothetical protein
MSDAEADILSTLPPEPTPARNSEAAGRSRVIPEKYATWTLIHLRLFAADRDLIDKAAADACLNRSSWAATALQHVLDHGMEISEPSSRSQHFDANITLRLPPELLGKIESARKLSYLRVWIRAALIGVARNVHHGKE